MTSHLILKQKITPHFVAVFGAVKCVQYLNCYCYIILTHSPDSHKNMDRNWHRLILDIPNKVGIPGAHRRNFGLIQTFWSISWLLWRTEINLGTFKRLQMKHKVTKYFWKTEDDHSQSVCEEYEDILCTVDKRRLLHSNVYNY